MSQQPKILAILGDKYHNPNDLSASMEVLAKAGFAMDVVIQTADLTLTNLKAYQGVLLAKGGYDLEGLKDRDWLGDKVEFLEDFVAKGGGLLCLHSGTSGYDLNPGMLQLAKASFTHHPPGPIELHYESCDRNFPAQADSFGGQDEQYFLRFFSQNTHHFLVSKSLEHGSSPAGWAHSYGEGRVLCLTPGHTREILLNPQFQQLLAGSLRWCLKQA